MLTSILHFSCDFSHRTALFNMNSLNIFLLLIVVSSESNLATPNPSDLLDKAVLGNDTRNLWWMVQITDVHLSLLSNFQSVTNFKQFVGEVLSVINPHAVLVTGDITNGISQGNYPLTGQQLNEWRRYNKVVARFLSETAENKTNRYPVWLDTRGNHDAFDVPSFSHYQNLYSAYSLTNSTLRHSANVGSIMLKDQHLVYQFQVDGVQYAIVLIDAAPTPGLRGPFNFFGYLSAEALEKIRQTDESLQSNRLTIWASHYPTAAILSGGARQILGNVIRYGAVFLCGHYHSFSSWEHNCYARHASGQLELELSDFRKSMAYRILAIDHGILSFVDVKMGQWPVILVTNPKPSTLAMPGYEPISKILESTHIRILAFSPFGIEYVQVSLNGKPLGNAKPSPGDPTLYTLAWNPGSLDMDVFHEITVSAVDKKGNTNARTRIKFFVKPSAYWLSQHGIVLPKPGGFFAQVMLLGSLANSLLGLFYSFTLFIAIIVFLLRCHHCFRVCRYFSSNKTPIPILSLERDLIFFFVFVVLIYPAIGPWFAGMMMSGTYGIVFPMGVILFDGRYIPEPSIAYAGIVYHFWFTIPVIIYFLLTGSHSAVAVNSRRCCYKRLGNRIFFALIIFFQLRRVYVISLAYGWLALVTNVPLFWMVILFIYVDVIFRRKLNTYSHFRVFDI